MAANDDNGNEYPTRLTIFRDANLLTRVLEQGLPRL